MQVQNAGKKFARRKGGTEEGGGGHGGAERSVYVVGDKVGKKEAIENYNLEGKSTSKGGGRRVVTPRASSESIKKTGNVWSIQKQHPCKEVEDDGKFSKVGGQPSKYKGTPRKNTRKGSR